MKRERPHLRGVQVLRAVGTALAEGRVEDVKDAATLLLANSNMPGATQQGGGRPMDLRPQLGLPPVVADELDHTPLGQSGFEAMLNWYLAAAEHQRGHYALSAKHASQATLLDANAPTEDHTRTNVLPSRTLLRTMASVSEVVGSFHQHMHDTDVAAARQLPKRLLATLPALEGEEPTLQSIEAQMVVLLNAAVISASAGEVTEAEAAIVTLLKKAVVLHLMTGTASINRESAPRAAKRRRTEPTKEESESKRGSTIEVVEQMAKEVINRTGPRGMPHDRAHKEEEAWDEYRQAREMIDRMGDVCIKAVHLLAAMDLSSSNVENWKRAKRILLRIIPDASANNDSRLPAVDDGSSRVALPSLRCHFPRFTVAEDDGPDCGLHITHYLLGVAYYLRGKLNKAVKALEGATRGDFYEAHYLLVYVHLRLGNFAAIPKLLDPITQSEDNLLAPDCLNLVAVAHAMQNELVHSLDALRMTLDARNTGSARCSLFNLVTVFGKQGAFDDQEGAISALRQAKAHGEGDGSDEIRPPHIVPLLSQGDLGRTQAVIVDAHDVSRLAIEYVAAKSALTQRDYKTALAHYRTIANTLKGSADVPDSLPVDGPVVWHEYLECLLATGAHTEIAATAELFLSLPLNEQDVSALFSVSQALFQLGKYEEALSVLERTGSAMPAAKMGKNKTTAAPHAALRVRLNNNKAMVMARLGRHEDALNHLQAVQYLATVPDQKLQVALNVAVLLTYMKREEDAARAWLSARGQPLDQLPSYYQRWIANVRIDSSAGSASETSYREMDRALGEVWRKCREQQRIEEEMGSLPIDCFDS